MVRVVPRNSIKMSKDQMNAQLLGWNWVGATFIKLRHLTSKLENGRLRPKW